jgi:hypothetical protein
MRGAFLTRLVGVFVVCMGCLALSGCGRGDPVNGKTYQQEGIGAVSVAFKNGKATVELMGQSKTFDYKVEGDKITIMNKEAGDLDLTYHSDGTLTGAMGTLRPSGAGEAGAAANPDDAPPAPAAASGAGREAGDAVMVEVRKHWSKGADGWITAYNSGNSFAPNYLRQLRDITVAGVETSELSEADKMNGVQWAGEVTFRKIPVREAGDPGPVSSDFGGGVMRTKGRWSQWVDVTPERIQALKVNGKWQFQRETMLLQGKQPSNADYQSAGVRP